MSLTKSKNLQFFFIALLLSAPFWWGMNLLSSRSEQFFLRQALATNSSYTQASAVLAMQLKGVLPIQRGNIIAPGIRATEALSVYVRANGTTKVLFSQNPNHPVPIASISKLMTALVSIKHYRLNQVTHISKTAIDTPENFGQLKVGDRMTVQDLLYPLLIESSNDAATALAEIAGKDTFTAWMNQEAQTLKLKRTHYVNASGLDPNNFSVTPNESTANDLATLLRAVKIQAPLEFSIIGMKTYTVVNAAGKFHHIAHTTNKLLDEKDTLLPIIAGKTGETELAKETFIVATTAPNSKGFIINVVLGSSNRFNAMRKLITWTVNGFKWNLPYL